MALKIVPAQEGHEYWEGTLWGVYDHADYEGDPPLALFSTRQEALAYMSLCGLENDCFVARTEASGRYANAAEAPGEGDQP